MRYLGGKTKLARQVAQVLLLHLSNQQEFVEPFMGGGSISVRMPNPRSLYDGNKALVDMWQQLISGALVLPVGPLVREDYDSIRQQPEHPLYTVVGFGLSYAGSFWQGYDGYYCARGKVGYTWQMLRNSVAKKVERLRGATIEHADYRDLQPAGALVYCDPPYQGTKEYKGHEGFDSEEFWGVVRRWSKHNTVLVSERTAPDDFEAVWQSEHKVQMALKQKVTTEKIFKWKKT